MSDFINRIDFDDLTGLEELLRKRPPSSKLNELEVFMEELSKNKTEEEAASEEKFHKEMAPFFEIEKKYLEAGLGDWMRQYWDYAPPAAKNYPGGPVAVYEEAIRRGVTWEEVCGYIPPSYITGFTE